jgi:hypothetical protein
MVRAGIKEAKKKSMMKPPQPPSGRLYSQAFIRDFMTAPAEPAPKPKRKASKKKRTPTKDRKAVARNAGKTKAQKAKKKS